LIRLATFNVLHGRSLADGRVDKQRLAEACASLDADVLGLQEVDRNQARSGSVDQAALVAEATGATAWRFAPALVGVPGDEWRPAHTGDDTGDEWRPAHTGDDTGDDPGGRTGDEPAYGVALVSRLPVAAWHVVPLAAAPVRSPVAVPAAGGRVPRFILLRDEPRVAVVAEVDAGGRRPLLVATTHLSFVPGYNLVQVRRLTARLAELAAGRSAVLLGDLNVPGPFSAWASGWRPLAAAKTFPAASPRLQVDHVLAHGAVPAATSVDARLLPLSDHRALVVEVAV
jgi:endonuclease/exonuclease/phosphatase family metal-dependent hydrolase